MRDQSQLNRHHLLKKGDCDDFLTLSMDIGALVKEQPMNSSMSMSVDYNMLVFSMNRKYIIHHRTTILKPLHDSNVFLFHGNRLAELSLYVIILHIFSDLYLFHLNFAEMNVNSA